MPLEYRLVGREENIFGVMELVREDVGKLTPRSARGYIDRNTKDPKGYIAAALITENPKEALKIVDDGLRECGENSLLYHARGSIYERTKNRDQAIEAFKRAIERDPINVEAIVSLGTILGRAGKHREAMQYWRQFLRKTISHGAGFRDQNFLQAIVEEL